MRFDFDTLTIELVDGRELSVPLEWFALLRDAPRDALLNCRIEGDGYALHWPDLDEDVRVVDLLYPQRFAREFH